MQYNIRISLDFALVQPLTILTFATPAIHTPGLRSLNKPHPAEGCQAGNTGQKAPVSQAYRYRLFEEKLPIKPDIVLPKYKTVIFTHVCFWHGHEYCRYFVIPKTAPIGSWPQSVATGKRIS